jgi:hypothetical protein
MRLAHVISRDRDNVLTHQMTVISVAGNSDDGAGVASAVTIVSNSSVEAYGKAQ